MRVITIRSNQSLLDIALQATGSAQNAFLLAKENGIGITAILTAGAELKVPDSIPVTREMLDFYTAKQIEPATDVTGYDIAPEEELEGIGYWIINKTFKVS